MSLCHKLKFSNPYIFANWWCKPLIFQTRVICPNRNHNLKYLRSTTLYCKEVGSLAGWQLDLFYSSLRISVGLTKDGKKKVGEKYMQCKMVKIARFLLARFEIRRCHYNNKVRCSDPFFGIIIHPKNAFETKRYLDYTIIICVLIS